MAQKDISNMSKRIRLFYIQFGNQEDDDIQQVKDKNERRQRPRSIYVGGEKLN
jgi:hypothetical protein